MQKINSYIGFCTVLVSAFLLLPAIASASTIYMETAPGTVSVGDTIVVRVYADTDTAANVLDGTVSVPPATSVFQIKDINLAGSVLTLWPRTPSLSADGTSISFTGGLPGGFSGSHVLLFSIVVTAKKSGQASFAPVDATLYLNDGKGTAAPVTVRALAVTVGPAQAGAAPRDEWQSITSGDTTPPESFTIVAGQDPSVFDGKKFIFFQTTDALSGIDHYEVKEGNAAPVRSGSTYVLQDQLHPVTVTVYAYDKMNNFRTAVYTTPVAKPQSALWIVLLVSLVAAAYVAWRLLRRTRRT